MKKIFVRFWERLAIRILLRSENITLVAIKDRDLSDIFIAANPSDRGAWAFFERNHEHIELEPDSMVLERLFHAPDAPDRESNT
ncbi:hypothetical protein [Nereida ignava]|uniref:hypothetical protein n=1 Tax=Nereida ignava TaxID=282199 RepID=UPI0030F84E04